LIALVGAALLLLAASVIYFRTQRTDAPALSVLAYIPPPPGTAFRASGGLDVGPVAVSPDGKTLAFSAVDEKGVTKLWLRPLDSQQASVLPGTEDAAYPFWSPDSQYLAFFAGGRLKKIGASAGDSQTLVDGVGSEPGIGTWSADGTILFCKEHYGVIYRVAATGGEASQVTKFETTDFVHRQPFFLPDGKHFLYVAQYHDFSSEIRVGDIDKPAQCRTFPLGVCSLSSADTSKRSLSTSARGNSRATRELWEKRNSFPSRRTACSRTTKVPAYPS
jgi:Tol biopolymer transport system component